MGLLDDYNPFLRGKPKLPGFPPLRSPADEERGRANIRTILEGKDIAGGSDPPELKGLNLFPEPKQQERLGPPPEATAADVADTFSPTPMTGMNPITPPRPFDPSRFADVPGGPGPTRVAAPAFPVPRPAGIDAPAPIRTAANVPTPPPRPASLGILSDQPLSPQRPTGVPTVTPPPGLVENAPLPPQRPAGLGDPAPARASAPTPPPIIPTSTIGSPIADFGKGGEFDMGQGLGGGLGNGSDDLGQGLGGSLGNGSDDLAFAGGGGDTADAGGGGDGGGGGGGFGGILGAIGGLAKAAGGGGGGGTSAPAPPVPVAKAPQLAPMAGDPGMAKRAQGAQQIMSGLLADPTLIDPRKKQAGLLA